MSVFAIADLHLSTNAATDKSMEVFGKRWTDYVAKLEKNWRAVVNDGDTVIIPGDISWALKLEEAYSDLDFLNKLPGKKLIGKGNHDFWWATSKKMQNFFDECGFDTISILYNNAYAVEDGIVCGTRGWFLEEGHQVSVGEVDYNKIVSRELIRLRISLDAAKKLQSEQLESKGVELPISVFLHFPPVWLDFVCREFVDALHEYGVKNCYFGHIHGGYNVPRSFEFENIAFSLISSDFLNFSPQPLRLS
ncbi:MAG: serine/threonine protein phosphatase [Ruminococcaceae bacterium]|nr:serine/threonine protein phosphatase [Oscillospiraceae bacterium]